uniref:RT04435p n=1 Tax=Drosophila melanogaster TaxID=7227 RepID=Q9VMZ8_DROME|eukprot:NP_649446.1 TweedleV [Drosophila melanogaster]
MSGFIVLCLCSVALAAPQGYNYNPGPSGFGGISTTTGGGSFFQGAVQVAPVQPQAVYQQPAAQTHHHQQQQVQQQQAIVSKRFFIHSAPEEAEDYKERHITVGVPKRNYNVVFIKSPQRNNRKTIKISPAANEEKTVIYVLSKKGESDLNAEVVEQASSTSKPEVFFIKYKTNEEAAHAQQQIQAQYDALGGSSQLTDEGVAPVTSVIGALGGSDGHIDGGSVVGATGAGQIVSTGTAGSHTGNAYLPPNF